MSFNNVLNIYTLKQQTELIQLHIAVTRVHVRASVLLWNRF